MATVERLMRASAVRIAAEAPEHREARWCFDRYFAELKGRFETGFDPAKSISAEDRELTPPAGVLVIARLDGRPIGCGALKVKGGGVGEVKRMWVSPDARGLGVGRRILEELEARAPGFGLATLRLETNKSLAEAQALYRSCGYIEVPPFNDEPYADHWFEKAGLSPAASFEDWLPAPNPGNPHGRILSIGAVLRNDALVPDPDLGRAVNIRSRHRKTAPDGHGGLIPVDHPIR
jgi:GNAT superfamily N-acetyltransferase